MPSKRSVTKYYYLTTVIARPNITASAHHSDLLGWNSTFDFYLNSMIILTYCSHMH